MPFFGKKKKSENLSADSSPTHSVGGAASQPLPEPPSVPAYQPEMSRIKGSTRNGPPQHAPPPPPPEQMRRPKYNFHCQLAHGSPTGIISGFTNVKELYSKIAECYDTDPNEIIFCTLNTHKIDMDRLLGGQIGLDDFIFAHTKGQKKEIEVIKSEDALGLTITDNGAGYAFIKRIKPDSIMDRISMVEVGDHIEKIDGDNFVGRRHFDVAKRLKEIPRGSTFTIRLISPEKSAYAHLNPRSGSKGTGSSITSGKKTLRLRAKGGATEEDAPNAVEDSAIMEINKLIETLLGIDDRDMAHTIWDLGKDLDNPHDFAVVVDRDMGDFGFPDDLVFDFWGAISDAKSGRLASAANGSSATVEFSENF